MRMNVSVSFFSAPQRTDDTFESDAHGEMRVIREALLVS